MTDNRQSFLEYSGEAKQVGVLYHFTKFDSIKKIIESGFSFQSHNGFISTTRNFHLSGKLFGEITVGKDYVVRIALDGNKLLNDFKIVPVLGLKDNGSDVLNINKETNKHRVSRHYEENEELIIPNRYGGNLSKYILSVDFSTYGSRNRLTEIDSLRDKLLNLGIPSRVYRKWGAVTEDTDYYDPSSYRIILNEH